MFTALVSLLSNKPARVDVAMTGEITLRGIVLPIGGVKEKVLAAHRAGIRTIILPKQNQKDLADVHEEVRKQITFHFVDNVEEVVRIALARPLAPPGPAPSPVPAPNLPRPPSPEPSGCQHHGRLPLAVAGRAICGCHACGVCRRACPGSGR